MAGICMRYPGSKFVYVPDSKYEPGHLAKSSRDLALGIDRSRI